MIGMMKEKPSDRILSPTPWSWLNTTPRSPAPTITKGENTQSSTRTTAMITKGLIFFKPGTSLNGSKSLLRAMASPQPSPAYSLLPSMSSIKGLFLS